MLCQIGITFFISALSISYANTIVCLPRSNTMYKMVAFDIDGTLLTYGQNQFRPEIRALFARLKARGLVVVLATGRDFVSIGNLHQDPNIDYFIGANGAFIYDLAQQRYRFNTTIDFADYERYYNDVIQVHHDNVYNVVLSDDRHVFVQDPARMNGHWFWQPFYHRFRNLTNAKTLLNHEQFHLITINCTTITPLLEASEAYFRQHNSSLGVQAWWPNGFFVANRGVDKAPTVAHLARELGIDLTAVIAFGDGENDLQLLQTVGHGVAMANSSAQVQAAARAVTTSVDDLGTIWYLEKLGII